MSYIYYEDQCAICGEKHPKREMNKIYIAYGHTSVSSPKLMCHVCDDCLSKLSDFLAVSTPDDTVNWRYIKEKHCKKCKKKSPKRALYCLHCGAKLEGTE